MEVELFNIQMEDWGGGVDHDYTKIIQIPTSSAVKWK